MGKPKSAKSTTSRKELVLFFSVPLVTLLIVVGLTWVPKLLANPQHDFIYSICSDYSCQLTLKVQEGIIYEQSTRTSAYYGESVDSAEQLFLYDVSAGESVPITIDEANRYDLDTSTKSPDGYVLDRKQQVSGSIFGTTTYDTNTWILKKGMLNQEIILQQSQYDYSDAELLGWVK